ncbi:MAG: hypothetical protein HGA87_00250 [Desulfobulbaceae bacterium]|nr:hypothetical protein [Desulfobulbaceae bacterium]
MFDVGLSSTGELPATHWIESGLLDSEELVETFPYDKVTCDPETGEVTVTRISDGDADTLFAILQFKSTESGVELTATLADIRSMFVCADVTEESAQEAMNRRGLKLITEPMNL